MENGIKKILLGLIVFYQKTLSPDHSERGKIRHPHGFCRYYPSCSEYAKQSIASRGIVKGVFKAFWRVMRCNPFSRGGYDPLTITPD